MRLQNLILQTAMPPNDFLILGSDSERVLFDKLQGEVDAAFAAIRNSRVMDRPRARSLATGSWEEWLKAKSYGHLLFAVERPVGNPEAGALMKVFDGHIDWTANQLNSLYVEIGEDIKRFESDALQVQRHATLFLIVIFLLAASSMVLIGYLLSRSITSPIQALDEGMLRFSQGDHSFRVVMDRADEFGHLAKMLNLMASQIECDSLTGLLSRQEFQRRLQGEVGRADRYGQTFSLLMLDLDHFKKVNDQHGHQAGDDVLRAITTRLSKSFRTADCLGRFGGEEFIAILPETDTKGAQTISDRLCELVAIEPVTTSLGVEISVTISIGVATFPVDASTGDALVAAADTALYAAKRMGRNQAVVYHTSLEPTQIKGNH
jgi:diguanylate cyclase (GGDEF)-like protein